MSQLPIYYKRRDTDLSPLFLKRTGNRVIQVNVYEEFNEYTINSIDINHATLEHFLVCPKSEFDKAFAKVMLKCEAMQLFPILGLDMTARAKAHLNQPIQTITDIKMNAAQQNNISY